MPDRTGWLFTAKIKIGTGASQTITETDTQIESFEFEDSEAEADKLKLVVNNFDLSNFDNPVWADGNIIEFQFGYAGQMSPTREAVITKVTGFAKLKVEALSKGVLMNRVPKTRIFENMTRSDVVRQIAEENGYSESIVVDIDDTTEVLSQITQSRMTDGAFVRDLARREGFEHYVDATGFHWHARRLGQKPVRQLTYYTDLSGDILAFPELEGDITAKPSAVSALGRDLLKKKDIVGTASNTDTQRDGLAPVVAPDVVVAKDTGAITPNTSAPNASGYTMATSERTQDSAQRKAEGTYKKAASGAVKLKVPIVGDPSIVAKSVVELLGLGKALSGNYYVTKHTTKGGTGGLTGMLETRRDGRTSSAGGASSQSKAKVNTQDGPADVSQDLVEKEVVDKATGETRKVWVDPRGQQ